MKERMQKILTMSDTCPKNSRTESKGYRGVQTFMEITENHLKEVLYTKGDLLERILSLYNLNRVYKQVMSNYGSGGIEGIETEVLLDWLVEHKEGLLQFIMQGRYKPNPVRRVEIPKEDGKKRILGIPTVVYLLVQQSNSQVLSPIYEREFSDTSYG